jgi:3-deoxy-D-manno-octulosonic-acid transferase
LLVLAELELWPNAILEAHRRGMAIAVVNGRMSPRSHRGYRRGRWFMRPLLAKVDLFAMQTPEYAERMLELGAPPERVEVTGSVKYDGVASDRNNARTRELASLLGWSMASLTWVVGSTQAPEEEMALAIYRRARERFPQLRLLLVPRHKERFEEVASLLAVSGIPHVRRSKLPSADARSADVVLLDTLGELSAAWGLADVAFVGGSLSQRGGQNMIEPAAYGAAVTFGPNVWNFQDTVDRLLNHDAAIQVQDAADWERVTLQLLADVRERQRLGQAAQSFVLSQQGAVARTLDLLEALLDRKRPSVRCYATPFARVAL